LASAAGSGGALGATIAGVAAAVGVVSRGSFFEHPLMEDKTITNAADAIFRRFKLLAPLLLSSAPDTALWQQSSLVQTDNVRASFVTSLTRSLQRAESARQIGANGVAKTDAFAPEPQHPCHVRPVHAMKRVKFLPLCPSLY